MNSETEGETQENFTCARMRWYDKNVFVRETCASHPSPTRERYV